MAQVPDPTILNISVDPGPYQPGEAVVLTVSAFNNGDLPDYGSISVSFPEFTGSGDTGYVRWLSSLSDSPGNQTFPVGSSLGHKNGSSITSQYVMLEFGDDNWQNVEVNQVVVEFTIPDDFTGDSFGVNVRSNMGYFGGQFYNDPSSSAFIDQQGWAVDRVVVDVGDPVPIPVITDIDLESGPHNPGDVVTLSVSAMNTGDVPDYGSISISFPEFDREGDEQYVSWESNDSGDSPGNETHAVNDLINNKVGQIPADYVLLEYGDNNWQNGEENTVEVDFTIPDDTPEGSFVVYVRSNMGNFDGQFYNDPSSSSFTDQQDWEVIRLVVDVVDPVPVPVITDIDLEPGPFNPGDVVSLTVSATNNGEVPDYGSISISFPKLNSEGDEAYASWASTASGDSPGNETHAVNDLINNKVGQIPAEYVLLEYGDENWQNGEVNTVEIEFTIPEDTPVGSFEVNVRSNMGNYGGDFYNDPSSSAYTDQQDWEVERLVVNVVDPVPIPSITEIDLEPGPFNPGDVVSLTVSATNTGDVPDYGSISVSFPEFTSEGDEAYASWASTASGDSPGNVTHAVNDLINNKETQFPAEYVLLEYGDENWQNGEVNTIDIAFTIPENTPAGTFEVYVRSNMGNYDGQFYNDPSSSSFIDQQDWEVQRLVVDVVTPMPVPSITEVDLEPGPFNPGDVVSLMVSAINTGDVPDYGSISISFPELTSEGDEAYVSWVSTASGDSPGNVTRGVNDLINNKETQIPAEYVLFEYGDENWQNGEVNQVAIEFTIPEGTPEGEFEVYVRSNMGYYDGQYYNDPSSSPYIDQQDWEIQRLVVQVEAVEVVNTPPEVQDIASGITPGVPIEIELVGTDTDNDALTYRIVQFPASGSVSLSGSVATYTSSDSFSGSDTFTYVANDGLADSEEARVTLSADAITELAIGNLNLEADVITDLGANLYMAVGNVHINNILQFEGSVEVNLNELAVRGEGAVYLTDIPVLGRVDLYDGAFDFDVDEEQLKGDALEEINNTFEVAGLPVMLENIELLGDGVRLEGKLQLPEILGYATAEVSTIQLTRSAGLQFAGVVEIGNVKVKDVVELESLVIEFDTITNTFVGEAKMNTRLFGIEAGTAIEEGVMDSISVFVRATGNPVPLGSTGLSIVEGGGGISGLANPPLVLQAGISLVPTVQGSFNAVELNDLTLTYTFGTSMEGTGALKLFNKDMANVSLFITGNQVSFNGDIDLSGILIGAVEATIAKEDEGVSVEGSADAILNIPAKDGFPFDLVSTLFELPYTVAHTENYLSNNEIGGVTQLTNLFKLTYNLAWNGSQLDSEFSTDFTPINFAIFGSSIKANASKQRLNRFEGQSLLIGGGHTNPGLKSRGNGLLDQAFSVDVIHPSLIIRVAGVTSMPDYTVTLPNGTIVTASNAAGLVNVEYLSNPDELKGFFVIENPPLGEWSVNITGSEAYELDLFGSNSAPSMGINLIEPSPGSVQIGWSDADPDNDAEIGLYYDLDNSGADGVQIAGGLSEDDNTDSYTWNYADIPTGQYYVYGVITDEVNSARVVYGTKPVDIVTAQAPEAPTDLDFAVSDTSITLLWNSSSQEVLDHVVYYEANGVPSYNSPSFNLGDVTTFNFTNLTPGKIYAFVVSAVDSQRRESALSNQVDVSFISVTQNNAPSILEQDFPTTAFTNAEYAHQLAFFDPDGDDLSFELITSPEGMSIADGGLISWIPTVQQVGNHLVELRASDMEGLADSVAFRVSVLDSLSSKGRLSFNKPIYFGYEDTGIISLSDINLNTSSVLVDSQIVQVYSSSDATGIQLLARETEANSGVFTTGFGVTENGTTLQALQVADGDSLWAEYLDAFPADTIRALSTFLLEDPTSVSIDEEEIRIPATYTLGSAYPNPFNPSTHIQYSIPVAANVTLEVYNISGQLVRTLVSQDMAPGNHIVHWNGLSAGGVQVASGVYLYRFVARTGDDYFIDTKKMILVK